jgi:hypothetical protein
MRIRVCFLADITSPRAPRTFDDLRDSAMIKLILHIANEAQVDTLRNGPSEAR